MVDQSYANPTVYAESLPKKGSKACPGLLVAHKVGTKAAYKAENWAGTGCGMAWHDLLQVWTPQL